MKVQHMLKQVAMRYESGGPISRQRDAAAILRLADALDEEGARTYLDRFIAKWRLDPEAGEAPLMQASPVVRRRPMPELEQRVYAELALGAPRAPQESSLPMLTIEGDGAAAKDEDANAAPIYPREQQPAP